MYIYIYIFLREWATNNKENDVEWSSAFEEMKTWESYSSSM